MNFGFFNYFLLLLTASLSAASRKGGKYCAACHVIVEEIEYEISKVDPRKILEIDGFRIDPKGNQMKRKTIPFARSETHLTEITESLCERMNEYALSKNKETGEEKYVLTKSRDGKPVTLENVSMSSENSEELRHLCNSVIEDHEESIIEFFKKEHNDPKTEFCTRVAGACEEFEEEEQEEEEKQKEEL